MDNKYEGPQLHDNPAQADEKAISEAQKQKFQRRFSRGKKLIGAGAALMALSFSINMFLAHFSPTYVATMYVLTTLGATLIVAGLGYIFGF